MKREEEKRKAKENRKDTEGEKYDKMRERKEREKKGRERRGGEGSSTAQTSSKRLTGYDVRAVLRNKTSGRPQ